MTGVVCAHGDRVEEYGPCRACVAASEAITRAGDHAPADWLRDARAVVKILASTRPEFVSDDVWALLPHPPEPRALGAVMRQMAREGVIAKTDRVRPSTRVECHARPIAIWTGRPQPVSNPVEETLF